MSANAGYIPASSVDSFWPQVSGPSDWPEQRAIPRGRTGCSNDLAPPPPIDGRARGVLAVRPGCARPRQQYARFRLLLAPRQPSATERRPTAPAAESQPALSSPTPAALVGGASPLVGWRGHTGVGAGLAAAPCRLRQATARSPPPAGRCLAKGDWHRTA